MADLIIHNAKVWTVNPARPLAEAVAVSGGRIEAVGPDAEIRSLAGERTEVIDARGRLLLPGFVDAHVHFLAGGLALLGVDLRTARDEREFAEALRAHVERTPPGEWITGGRWDHESWPSRRRPTRGLIDPFTPRHPVLVSRLDGHMALANTPALKLAGIGPDTPDPAGGRIERDERGEPTGIVIDAALELVARVIPPPGEEQLLRAARAAMGHAAALGVTSVHSPVNRDEFLFLLALHRRGELTTRLYAMPELAPWRRLREEGVLPLDGDATFRAWCVKVFADGSLGAGSALLSRPYCDNPSSGGLAIHSRDELRRIALEIDAAHFRVAVHAIGERAVRWALDAFEEAGAPEARGRTGPRDARGPRFRIEHAQVVHPAERARFARLGIIASIQPSHCIDDMRWVARRLGERTRWAYPFRSLLDTKAAGALGTDWPVETLDPMLTLYAAVTRERPEGGPPGGWHGGERVTIEEAIRCYTLGGAFAEFHERNKGSIEPGRLADMVILSRDILTVPPRDILSTHVDMTVFDGRVIWSR